MSYAKIKQILKNYRNFKNCSINTIQSINSYLNNMCRAGVLPCSAIPEAYKSEIIQMQQKLNAYENYAKKIINLVPSDLHRRIMYDRYINGLSWENLAEKYHFSTARIYEINRNSIKEILNAMPINKIPIIEFV